MFDDGDRVRTIISLVIARSWRDEGYRAQLLTSPRETLIGEGVEIPETLDVRVLLDTDTVTHVNLAPRVTDAKEVLNVFQRFVPLADRHELRVVQSSERLFNLVIPVMPGNVIPEETTERDLVRLAADGTSTTTNTVTNVDVSVEAAVTAVEAASEASSVVAVIEAVAS